MGPRSAVPKKPLHRFESLASALHATPGFPCCAFEGDAAGFQLDACSGCRPIRRFKAPVRCAVEDQACLQVALAARGAPRHAVDRNASLFLSLNFLRPADLALKGGRLAFKHTGEVPCVLHSNGKLGKLMMRRVVQCAPPDAWIAPAGNPWEQVSH